MSEFDKIEEMFQRIEGNMNQMNTKLDTLVSEMKLVKEENVKLKAQILEQEGKIINLEREVRKKNIVIKGVTDEENENENELRAKLQTIIQKISMNIDIKADTDQARRIGGYSKDKKRPIHVKLTKESTKLAILQNAKKLKESDIWIDQDYTKKTQEERRRLIPQLKEARKKGFKAQLKFNMLIVNDQIYKVEDLRKKEKWTKEIH
ncbi:hypothetical protein RN001_013947 [Aquatica leii]|uniref:Uncharacterized protein n=1 Tax=Aquatica leii TaxID=1421715 RepID=A0AAN7P0R3_9COLE|nr:hypothetical protein RN001_013947 [Aquatica leii]